MERLDVNQLSKFRRVAEIDARYALLAQWAEGRRVLDLGGASGSSLALLAEAGADEMTAVSAVSSQVTSELAELGIEGVDVFAPEGPPTSFADGAFDLVICHDLPERLAAGSAWQDEIRRILAPGGILVVSLANEKGRFLSELGADRFAARSSYEDLYKLLKPVFGKASIFGQSPVVASLFFDFEADDDEMGMSFDRALLTDEGEEPGWYLLLFGEQPPHLADLTIIQLPLDPILAGLAKRADTTQVSATAADTAVQQAQEQALEQAQARIEALTAELNELRARPAEAEPDQGAQEQIAALTRELDTAKEQAAETAQELGVAQKLAVEAGHRLEAAQQESLAATRQIEAAQQEALAATKQIEAAQQEALAATKQIEAAQQETADAFKQIEAAQREKAEMAKKADELETSAAQVRGELDTLRQQNSALGAEVAKLAEQLAEAQKHQEELEAAANKRVHEAQETAQEMLTEAQEGLGRHMKEMEESTSARMALAEQNAKVLAESLAQAQEKLETAEQEVASAKAAADAAQKAPAPAVSAESVEKVAQLEEQTARFQKDRVSLETQIRDLLEEVDQLRQKHDKNAEETAGLKACLEARDQAVQAATAELLTLRQSWAGADNEANQLREELARLKMKVMNTETEREAIAAELNGLRQTLQAQETAALSGTMPEPAKTGGQVTHDAVGRQIETTLEDIEDLLATAVPRR